MRFFVPSILIPGLVALGYAAIVACGTISATHRTELEDYGQEQTACVLAHKGDKAAQDSCRAQVKKRWCDHWANDFDAGVCQ